MTNDLLGRTFEEADQALCMGDLTEAMVKIAREVRHTSMHSRKKDSTKSPAECLETKKRLQTCKARFTEQKET